MASPGNEIDVALEELEARLERLRALYEQYFIGIEKLEPSVPRQDVDRRIYALRKIQIRNTAKRFKLQTIIQRYNAFQQYWLRVCREIENGTYHRHVARAQNRFGDVPLTAAMRRKARRKADAEEKEKQTAAEQKKRATRAAEDDLQALLAEDIEAALAGVLAAADELGSNEPEVVPTLLKPGAKPVAARGAPVLKLERATHDAPAERTIDVARVAADPAPPQSWAAVQPQPAPRVPAPEPSPALRVEPPDAQGGGASRPHGMPPPKPSARRAATRLPEPPAQPPAATPAASREAQPRPPPPRADGASRSLEPRGASPPAAPANVARGVPKPGQPSAASPAAAASASAASQHTSAARSRAGDTEPRASGAASSARRSAPRTEAWAALRMPEAPKLAGAPTGSEGQPSVRRAANASSAATSASRALAHGRPPAVSGTPTAERPLAPTGTSAATRPATAPSPPAAAALTHPEPGAQQRATAAHARAAADRAAEVRSASAEAAASRLNQERLSQLHSTLVAERQRLQQPGKVSMEALASSLRETERKLRRKYAGKDIDFHVVVKDGRAVVKPIVE